MKKLIIESIDNFIKILEKYKAFRELPEQYKSTKFCKLYYKMYNYMRSIPKEKIVLKTMVERNGYLGHIINIISYFIEAKDFYCWKYRIYSLLTEKLHHNCYRKFELYYGSKAKIFYNKSVNKIQKTWKIKTKKELNDIDNKKKATYMLHYNKEYYFQTEEFKENLKLHMLEKLGVEYPMQSKEVQEKSKITSMKNWGTDHPMQSKEVQEKYKITIENTYGSGITNISQVEEIKKKKEKTFLKNYGVKCSLLLGQSAERTSHSKFGNEVCTAIDNALDNPEDSIYYIKSGYEYCIHTDTKNYYIDMVIPSLGLAFEADGVYFHGLLEDQEYVFNTPVEEVWKYDQEKTIAIEKAGFKLFRIREDEYKKDPKGTIEKLLEQIKEGMDI